ncbi:MAG: tetratricopeptide repeat protein [Deltaproteobacteria bacterium]|nr:tetratricopeptide repeat protein [Deltaproteobacteria bacterium]
MSSKRLEMLEHLIAQGTRDPFHHYAYALELRSIGKSDAAFEKLKEIVKQFPEYVPAYLMGAQLAFDLGRFDEGMAMAQAGIEVAERSKDSRTVRELMGIIDTARKKEER